MGTSPRTSLAVLCFALLFAWKARAESLALKSGETADLGIESWVVNCRSLLTGPITVEIMEGPLGMTASVREQKVIPRKLNCANEVPGGHLLVTAPKDVTAKIQGTLTLRLKYPTKDGDRQLSRTVNVTLFP